MYSVEQLRPIVSGIAAAMPISLVLLVGSYAKGAATENSDVDLVVDGRDLSEAYWDFLFRVEDALTVPVDVMTRKSLDRSILKDDILEGGVTLYEA